MTITARNYASQAIAGLTQFYDALPEDRHIAKLFGKAILEQMKQAVHFSLPDGGLIFDDNLRCIIGRTIKLPYPIITIEWHNSLAEKSHNFIFDKHVVLAIDRETDIEIWSCFHIKDGKWLPAFYGIELDVNAWMYGPPENNYKFYEKHPSGFMLANLPCRDVPHHGLLDIAERTGMSAYEIRGKGVFVLNLIEALSCSNVRHEPLEPVDQRKNARRIKAGKLPIYETRILTIETGKQTKAGICLGGSHSSPRQHLRRGHIRRLPDKNVWVNPCVVGRAENGVIDKQYHVKAA